MSTEKKLEIAVIGGGIGGLCAAIGLLKHPHINVQVYEAAHKFAEIGAGVAFGPNSQRAMAMIDPKIHDAFLSQATHNGWPSKQKEWFQVRMGMEGEHADELITAPDNQTGQTTVHRALFLDELVKLVPSEIAHFGKRLVKIVDGGEGHVHLQFLDGTAVTVDAVIGADGVHSPTRKYLLGDDHPAANPKFSNCIVYRGLIPMEVAKEKIGAEYAENSVIWLGEKGSLMIYPISFGKIMNVVASRNDIPTWDDPKWIVPAKKGEIRASLTGRAEFPAKVLELLEEADVSQWALWDYDPAPYFNKGNVCIMGDAAHATLPFQGAGAGMAIEDALVLHALLENVDEASQVVAAFKAYNAVRLERACKNTITSRETGDLSALQMKGVGDDIAKIKHQYETRLRWIWDFDLEEQNRAAFESMEEFLGQQS